MKYDVFISYSSRNMETALAICHVLENNNIRCWMAPRNIPAGADYGDVIDRAITECKVFLLLYSEPATTSPWVNGELNLAFTEGRHIVPYRIDQTPLKGARRVMLNQRHWIDAHPDANDEFKSLVDNILPIFSTRNINTNSKRSSAITNTVIDKSTDKTQGAETIDTNNNVLPPLANKTKTLDKTAILHIRPDIDCIMMKFGEQIAELKAIVYNHI